MSQTRTWSRVQGSGFRVKVPTRFGAICFLLPSFMMTGSKLPPERTCRRNPNRIPTAISRGHGDPPTLPDAMAQTRTCFRVYRLGLRVKCLGLWVHGSGSKVQVLGFRIQGSWFRVQGSGFRGWGSGFRVHGLGFRVQGLGFRIQGSWIRV